MENLQNPAHEFEGRHVNAPDGSSIFMQLSKRAWRLIDTDGRFALARLYTLLSDAYSLESLSQHVEDNVVCIALIEAQDKYGLANDNNPFLCVTEDKWPRPFFFDPGVAPVKLPKLVQQGKFVARTLRFAEIVST